MKKIIWTLSALGLAFGMSACGDDDSKRPCNHGTKTGCISGEWLECVFEENNERGFIKAHLSIEIDGSTFVCDNNNNLVPDCSCKDGKLVDNNDNSIVKDAICTIDGNIYSCNGDELVTNNGMFCDNGKPMACQNGTFQEAICGENGEIYTCNGNELVTNSGIFCDNGKPMACQNGTIQETICGENGEIYACDDNNNLTTSFSYCNGNSTVKCNGGQLTETTCPEDKVCETYERSGSTYASCFKKEDVKTGCADDLKPYGSCAENILSFCTNSDPKLGKTIELKCADKGQTCKLVEEENYGYDCVYECQGENNASYTDRGYCEGTTLHWCEPTNEEKTEYTYKSYNCNENANVSTDDSYYNKTTCGFTTDFFDCK